MYGDYVYGSPCITGYYWTQKAVKKRICTGQGGTWDGVSCTFEPEPEPHWEPHSTYRGIDIQVWMPDGTPFTAYFDGKWHTAAYLSTLKAAIDDFLDVGIPTTLTLSAPSRVGVDEKFNVSGILYKTESGVPVPGQPINLSYNGTSLGTATTGVDGDYLKQTSISTEGVHTLKAEFPGAADYAASSRTTRMGVGVPLTQIPYIAILPIVTGLAVAHLFKR